VRPSFARCIISRFDVTAEVSELFLPGEAASSFVATLTVKLAFERLWNELF